MKNKKVHRVVYNDNCYYCKICKKASGDGDGLVGKKCAGKNTLSRKELIKEIDK